jgi:alpha-glucosidase
MAEPIDIRFYLPFLKTGRCERLERGFELELESEIFRVTVLREDLLQLKISHAGRMEENPSHAVCADLRPMGAEFTLEETEASLRLQTAALLLEVGKSPFRMKITRADGSVILETGSDKDGTSLAYARLNDQFVSVRRCRQEDAIWGLGEKTGRMNRKGRNFTLWNTDVLNPNSAGEFASKYKAGDPRSDALSTEFDPYYVSIPFFYHHPHLNSGMAGFFFDNPYRGDFEFSEKAEFRIHFHGGQYTEYVFAGPSMRDVLAAYTGLTGRMQAPPIWALGSHQCRWFAYTQDAVERLAAAHREKKIPCDVLWLDIDYMDSYRVFTWNKERFPGHDQMLARLREEKFRVVTIIDPGVKYDPGYPVFDEANEKDLFCRTPGGAVYIGQVWPGRTAFPDFSLEETRTWWGRLNAEHVASGLAGIWNDMNEPATGKVPDRAMWFQRGTVPHERYHNEYAMLMAMGTTEGLLSAMPNLRTFVLTRAGSPGIQRYAAHWLGDNASRWEHLWMSIPMAMGFGISGQPFLGADVGGFVEQSSMELQIRWYQYGALTPFFRNHNCAGQADQYPWVWGEAAEALCREAVELRYRLMPYIYTQFMLAAETGEPIQKPLLFECQDDQSARHIDDQFFFGRDLLISPIFREGQCHRNVYLPAGTWHDWRSSEIESGRRWITSAAPISSIPVHVRGGSVIPMWPEAPDSTMGYFPEAIVLHVFLPKDDGEWESVLHEDDGTTFGFRDGRYLRTTFQVRRTGSEVTIRATTSGEGFPEFARKRFAIQIHGAFRGAELRDVPIALDQTGQFEFANSGQPFVMHLEI